ncbi:MAG: hypothetical protein ABI039_07005 [Vicinamibacterales bacterium]
MSEPASPRIFFAHVMKTGGATFRQHVYNNYGPEEVYPDPQLDLKPEDIYRPNFRVSYLLALEPARRERIRAYMGHFPFAVAELLDIKPLILTILRDPVERTISYLKHCKRYHPQHRDLTLEEIYADPFYYPRFIENHQAKVFSMTPDDDIVSSWDVLKVDADRLRIACGNLEKVDVLGLHEHYGEFVEEIRSRLGWRIEDVANWHVSEEAAPVSDTFRGQIAADNAADMAFYQFARDLHARRRHSAGGSIHASGR